MKQLIIEGNEKYAKIIEYLKSCGTKKMLLVCGNSLKSLSVNEFFCQLSDVHNVDVIRFTDYTPNPIYEDVLKGVETFVQHHCDMIMAVGGGSAIDVAKGIKLYSGKENIPLVVMPTTAGSGSESTRFAVVYKNGEKMSLMSDSIYPDVVIFDSDVLKGLPLYQKKSTVMDAFCHSIESFWSVNSTAESVEYSRRAIKMILDSYREYIYYNNDCNKASNMMQAANLAGRAINITQTTAGHAMCYKLTSLYKYAHGHSAALCVSALWKWMLDNIHLCIDPRGAEHLVWVFDELADAMGSENAKDASIKFGEIVNELGFERPEISEKELQILVDSVNPERLKNNPVKLSADSILHLYHNLARSIV